MRFAIIGSGSKGNCVLVESGGTSLLIDAGFGPRELRRRIASVDAAFDWLRINALLLTHAHGDHVKGARQLAGTLGIPTYCTAATARFASTFTQLKNHVPIDDSTVLQVGTLTVHVCKTPHDEPGSVCYRITDGDESFGYVTDLGEPAPHVGAFLRGCDSLVVEFNHDEDMLKRGPYSAHLKRRILSKYGHLSNDDGARLLAQAYAPSTSRVLLAHLSEVNNTPDLALRAARAVVPEGAITSGAVDVAIAPQHHPTSWLRVRRRDGAAGATAAVEPPRPRVVVATKATPTIVTAALAQHTALQRQLAFFSSTKEAS
jgi:phosphoribosyl 1,2-cyclic phosphodiesterase